MATIYVTFSALITALNNLLIRRGIDDPAASRGDPFIIWRFFIAALISILMIYVWNGSVTGHSGMTLVGIGAGLMLGILQYTIGRCLQYGPAAMSFIVASSVCVFPSIFMFFLFGEEFGHGYSIYNFLGSSLVLLGLYWMGATQERERFVDFKKWIAWAAIVFASGVLYNSILQWRALLLHNDLPESVLLPFRCEASMGDPFIAIMFFVAAICQLLFDPVIKPLPGKQILAFGLTGGCLYVVSSLLLLLSTECAVTSTEKGIIFPLNTVLLIFLCNIWGRVLYQEKINWPANGLCALGVIMAT